MALHEVVYFLDEVEDDDNGEDDGDDEEVGAEEFLYDVFVEDFHCTELVLFEL